VTVRSYGAGADSVSWAAPPLPSPIVATAWRYLLELDTPDTSAINDFARAHYQESPEPNGGPAPA